MVSRILVIDDEPDIRQVLRIVLRKEGYEVLCAGSGQDGLDLLAAQQVDLVMLDIIMPEMDGWEVCRRLRDNPATRHLPILIVTGDRNVRVHLVQNMLANAFLLKPFQWLDLLRLVRELLPDHDNDAAIS